ncbi:MAG TPA: hypothetical protein VM537_08565, partial [Anaerolineae bacterium]|nr:hypothetical protein [Anaerolineae bacterium]
AFAELEAGVYTTRMSTSIPGTLLLEGSVQIWVEEGAPRREAITDYSIGASPAAIRGRGAAIRGRGTSIRGHGAAIRGRGAAIRGRGAPVLSGDGQVTIYTADPTIPDGEFLTIQAATGSTELPAGRVQIGRAYRIAATQGLEATIGESSISFQYIGEAVPPGMEEDITIYFWEADQGVWSAIPTTLNTYDNFASARLPGSGLYALLTSFRVPLYAPGWNLFSYPVRTPQPVAEALVSVSGVYSTVYGFDATDATDPWKVYDVSAPGYVNDLNKLEFGHGYWISVTQAISIHFGSGLDEGDAWAASFLPPHVPATYYGEVQGAVPGAPVQAWVGDNLCGQAQTLEFNGTLVYSINVMAAAGASAGCGEAGRRVTFRVGSQVMSPAAAWNNSRLFHVPLSEAAYQLYLPLTEGE